MLLKFLGLRQGQCVSRSSAFQMIERLEDRRLLASTATGIDPANMGKGDWIVAVNLAAVNVGADTFEELASAMAAAGFKYVVVKAGDGNDGPLLNYGDGIGTPTVGSWGQQFSRELIDALHAVGVKVLAYQFIYGGGDVTGTTTFSTPGLEEKVAKDILSLGPDGLVISADSQLENATNNATVTENYLKAIRAAYPDTFLAYAGFAYAGDHSKFPYEQFSKYCDAAMPKAYYLTLSKANNSPEKMVADLNAQWGTLYASFVTKGHPEYKIPIAPIGQGSNVDTQRVTESRMNRWFEQLRTNVSPANSGLYNGTSFFSVQDHTPEMWRGIRANALGAPGGIIDGKVFNDNNGDGLQSSGEANLLGWTVFDDANNNGAVDKGEVRTTTDATGKFRLFFLPAGNHIVRVQPPSGLWRMTTGATQTVTVGDEQTLNTTPFGATQNPQVAGTVYNDVNADGTRQTDEPGLAGATVWVDFDQDGKLDKGEPFKITRGNGRYAFTVPVGSYIVRHVPPAGYRGVAPNRGFHRVSLLIRGQTVDSKTFGDTTQTLIKGLVFTDNNRNGIFDSGDDRGAPTTIWADVNGNGLYDALTEQAASIDTDGVYRLIGLAPGTYRIRAETPGGWVRTRPSGSAYLITLASGSSVSKKDFGQYFAG